MITPARKTNTAVVVPFFNEEGTIHSIINSTLLYTDFIIAVNDGSTDKSLELIPKTSQIMILNLENNVGKGHAIKVGLEKSIELGFEYSITLDADLQHDPSLIPSFIQAIGSFDIVIGNRLNDLSKMPLQRILSNHITSFLLSLKTGVKIKDSQSGYRIFRNNVLQDILPSSNGFEAESEMIIKAAKNKLRIGFINIPTIYGNEKSKIRPVQTIVSFLKVLLLK